jgi:alpha-L-fucosidase
MWPSNYTDYSIAATPYQGGKGDILRQFADAANKWGIKICYYINPLTDGYHGPSFKNVSKPEFVARQKGMLKEVLENYGPVNRLWFDGPGGSLRPSGLENPDEYHAYYDDCFKLIRETSPNTLLSPKRGDVCASTGSLYTTTGPAPNSTDSTPCGENSEAGQYFHPNEVPVRQKHRRGSK